MRRSSHRRRQARVASTDTVQQVVDLTCDDYVSDEQFVDLTDFDGSAVIIPSTPTSTPGSTPAARDDGDDLLTTRLVVDDLSDDDLPPVPFKITAKPRTRQSVSGGQSNDSGANTTPKPTCPVCLDSLSEVKAAGRQVMATTCGHVFCDECIQGVLDANAGARKCPTCRKKLSTRSVHPLYI